MILIDTITTLNNNIRETILHLKIGRAEEILAESCLMKTLSVEATIISIHVNLKNLLIIVSIKTTIIIILHKEQTTIRTQVATDILRAMMDSTINDNLRCLLITEETITTNILTRLMKVAVVDLGDTTTSILETQVIKCPPKTKCIDLNNLNTVDSLLIKDNRKNHLIKTIALIK